MSGRTGAVLAGNGEAMFLCYDLKGIQSFIFQVPKLKYIVGGSALIDRFDRVEAREVEERLGVRRVFSGGGRGVFVVDDKSKARGFQSNSCS
jgi:CRISPR/Cas system-associated protein Cas10 (large subunit of type III CRISPR-Cas system)